MDTFNENIEPFTISLPVNHSWKKKNEIVMKYPPPSPLDSGRCLGVEASGRPDQSDTGPLQRFFRKLCTNFVTTDPERDYRIYFVEGDDLGVYFSIAEITSFSDKTGDYEKNWTRFEELYYQKLQERAEFLGLAPVDERRQAISDGVEDIILSVF